MLRLASQPLESDCLGSDLSSTTYCFMILGHCFNPSQPQFLLRKTELMIPNLVGLLGGCSETLQGSPQHRD